MIRNCVSPETLQYHLNSSKQTVIFIILAVYLTNGNGITSLCMGSAATYVQHACWHHIVRHLHRYVILVKDTIINYLSNVIITYTHMHINI